MTVVALLKPVSFGLFSQLWTAPGMILYDPAPPGPTRNLRLEPQARTRPNRTPVLPHV